MTLNDLPMPPVARIDRRRARRPRTGRSRASSRTRRRSAAASRVLEQLGDRALHEHVDAERDRALLEGADHLQAGAVADVGEPGVAVAAEVALGDQAVVGAVEQRAPLLELDDPLGRLLGVQLGHPPVVEHLPAAHGVAEVHLPVVLGPHGCPSPRRCRPRPSRCAPCRAATCRRSRSGRRRRGRRSRRAGRRRRRRSRRRRSRGARQSRSRRRCRTSRCRSCGCRMPASAIRRTSRSVIVPVASR